MKEIILGKTNIKTIQNGFGCLPIQRVSKEYASMLLLKAYNHGITFFDTARAYSDSEEKIGEAFKNIERSTYYLATKTEAKNVNDFWNDLHTSLKLLNTSYVDIYQFHQATQVYKPNDGTNMYEAMLEAKNKGLIRYIGITTHRYKIAEEIIDSKLYDTLQYPFSYLSSDVEFDLVNKCQMNNIGFIAMKGLCGGLLNNSRACFAFMSQFNNVIPIWGIQRENELNEWLSYIEKEPKMDENIRKIIDKDRKELGFEFCRGCGYCLPCSVGIEINQCARMSQMIRRSPSASWLSDVWQEKMNLINSCIDCKKCLSRCPYQLNIPNLLKKNLNDYNKIINGEIKL